MENEFKKERKKYNITRKEVSDKLEIPYRTLENWEQGNNIPPKYVKKMYFKALKEIAEQKNKGL